ncbi:uncharacterized protein [Miscanthus floridulus]|uniref:uncharacterized protein isoform X7 n=1 Tax=Miscanthus floridulus TaxID=154761 RepID=UPI0034582E44
MVPRPGGRGGLDLPPCLLDAWKQSAAARARRPQPRSTSRPSRHTARMPPHMATISHRIAGSGPRVAVVAPPRPRGRAAVVAGAAAKGAHRERTLEGASDDLRAAAAKCLDWAPARRRGRAAFAPVLPTLDHCLFKMPPKGIQMEEATGRRPPGQAGHRPPGEAAGHQDARSGWTRRTCARRPRCAGSAGTCCAQPKTGAPRSGGGHGGQRRRGRGVLPGCAAAVRVGGDPCGHPQALLGLCCLSGGPKLQSLGKVILVALAATMHVSCQCRVLEARHLPGIHWEAMQADVLEYYDQTVSSRSGSFYIPAVFRANDAIGDWKEEGAAARR